MKGNEEEEEAAAPAQPAKNYHQLASVPPNSSDLSRTLPLNYALEHNVVLHHNNPQTTAAAAMALDRLSFADVMQFAEFGPRLPNKMGDGENYFLTFPAVLGDHQPQQEEGRMERCFAPPPVPPFGTSTEKGESSLVQEKVTPLAAGNVEKISCCSEMKNRRKRPRSVKTSEEVESQRMTHIAVERNRRKQMNEHLRVLRSLMPGSYVQRGDQASIIGGAIEFVRELEQLLQCLESQKRRRLYGTDQPQPQQQPPPIFLRPSPQNTPLSDDLEKLIDSDVGTGVREEAAEVKSCLADVEVKVLGFDAMIKILCRKRPGQLLKTIAALEELQFDILRTNITTVEQTVLYSLNVKMVKEVRLSAEDIANSVQQIYSFIHSST
uniref:BHLH transcription factor n=1 Tax=Potamogeton wrightii TaxID=384654 RepID=A0A1C9ZU84_9LILI|nr:bHLH transcription factor [Potamogeton wrightii]